MPCKMSNEDLIKFLVENRKDENGNLDLANLDLSKDFENVYFDGMKVKGNLVQNSQTVGGDLVQNFQNVGNDLFQNSQTVGNDLFQNSQTVGNDLFQSCQTAKRMILQSHDGLEQSKDGRWHKVKALAEKAADSDLDENLKREILANLKKGGE